MEDLDAISTLHRESILELCTTHYTMVELSQWIHALEPDKYIALFADREVFVAEENGRILGFAVLDLRRSIINATYVSPKTVLKGIGRGLVEMMENVAKQGGVSQLQLNSTLNAVPFYEHLGYAQGRTACNRLPTGIELPCVLMSKNL